jgi:hypothetical protein
MIQIEIKVSGKQGARGERTKIVQRLFFMPSGATLRR